MRTPTVSPLKLCRHRHTRIYGQFCKMQEKASQVSIDVTTFFMLSVATIAANIYFLQSMLKDQPTCGEDYSVMERVAT